MHGRTLKYGMAVSNARCCDIQTNDVDPECGRVVLISGRLAGQNTTSRLVAGSGP